MSFTLLHISLLFFFFFNDTATTEIYTLSLHDALPIYSDIARVANPSTPLPRRAYRRPEDAREQLQRSEEHTSELQSRLHLVCRLLLEKKKKFKTYQTPTILTAFGQTVTIYSRRRRRKY